MTFSAFYGKHGNGQTGNLQRSTLKVNYYLPFQTAAVLLRPSLKEDGSGV